MLGIDKVGVEREDLSYHAKVVTRSSGGRDLGGDSEIWEKDKRMTTIK